MAIKEDKGLGAPLANTQRKAGVGEVKDFDLTVLVGLVF